MADAIGHHLSVFPIRHLLLRLVVYALLTILASFIAALGYLYFRQESLLFFPSKLPIDYRFDLPGVTEEHVAVEGATLSALHYRQPNSKGVIFFLHGNGGTLRDWLQGTDFYRRNRYDLFMIDYRGYGKSTGKIESEKQLHDDVLTAWRSIEKEYKGRKNIIYGRSLGTGLATRLVTQLTAGNANAPGGDIALLVLVSPYLSLQQIGSDLYPWVPGFVMRYPMHTDQWLPDVHTPTLILHGEQDELIPVAHARKLKEIKPDAELVIVPGASHNDIHTYPIYIETLEKRLAAL